jgi:zinc transporter ZupT
MNWYVGTATFFATLFGGLFALRLKDHLHLILGFSAGAVIGVAFFDLMPESLELAGSAYGFSSITAVMAAGFLLYLIVDRFVLLHGHADEAEHPHGHAKRGYFGAGSLSCHSFLDGLGVGLALKVSQSAAIIVAVAVVAHDFSDGINTVNMILKTGGERRDAFRWLLVDAIAPSIGLAVALCCTVSTSGLGLLLALFSGFFLYIGASDLLPESHHAHPVRWTTIATVAGMSVLYVATRFAP